MLTSIECPSCNKLIQSIDGERKTVNKFEDCLRNCFDCGIGFSNAKSNPTIIYREPEQNIPNSLRLNWQSVLYNSVNTRNRKNKLKKFAFGTSEDALSWSVFSYLKKHDLLGTFTRSLNIKTKGKGELYLWGVNVDNPSLDDSLTQKLFEASDYFLEKSNSITEPDVILHFPDSALIVIEVKYLSKNEIKKDRNKLEKYIRRASNYYSNEEKAIISCHYELIRNWSIGNCISSDLPFHLVNLGKENLFKDKNSAKLKLFTESLALQSGMREFKKLTWKEVVSSNLFDGQEVESYLRARLPFAYD